MAVSTKLPGWLEELTDEYNKRISHWAKAETLLIQSPKVSRDGAEIKTKAEAELILRKIEPGDFLVLCDEKGKTFSTLAFSSQLEKILNRSAKRVVFLIGGAYGVENSIRDRADLVLSLSALTFNHQLALAILSEQVYRAFTVLKGVRYHNE